jgi:hypothetical protein
MPKPWNERQRDYAIGMVPGGDLRRYKGESYDVVIPQINLLVHGTQITGSEGHSKLPQKDVWEKGGPFFSVKAKNFYGWSDHTFKKEDSLKGVNTYSGGVYTPLPTALNTASKKAVMATRISSDSDLDRYGTEAVSFVAPTNPAATIAEGIAEIIREGIPTVPGIQGWKNRANLLRAAGSEFLNYEFGWAPLIREIEATSKAVSAHGSIMAQYARDAGKRVRRQYHFPIIRSATGGTYSTNTSAELPGGGSSYFIDSSHPAILSSSTTIERRRWFSGAFSYALPSTGNAWQEMLRGTDQANHLLGINVLSPEVLWALTPWSWAVDWFSDAGDLVNDLAQFKINGLVMPYGFIMEESTVKQSYELSRSGLYNCPVPPPSYTEIVWKLRRPANPFGFGIGWEDLSPTQLAIAAAVGISLL